MKIVNAEFKARCDDHEELEKILTNSSNLKSIEKFYQVDTYFKVNSGRLKLREEYFNFKEFSKEFKGSSLIYYERPNIEGPRISDIEMVPRVDPDEREIKGILKRVLGILNVVEKNRSIYTFQAGGGVDEVRVLLDDVKDLGKFVEVEVIDIKGINRVISDTPPILMKHCLEWKKALNIKDINLIANSYSDLILKG